MNAIFNVNVMGCIFFNFDNKSKLELRLVSKFWNRIVWKSLDLEFEFLNFTNFINKHLNDSLKDQLKCLQSKDKEIETSEIGLPIYRLKKGLIDVLQGEDKGQLQELDILFAKESKSRWLQSVFKLSIIYRDLVQPNVSQNKQIKKIVEQCLNMGEVNEAKRIASQYSTKEERDASFMMISDHLFNNIHIDRSVEIANAIENPTLKSNQLSKLIHKMLVCKNTLLMRIDRIVSITIQIPQLAIRDAVLIDIRKKVIKFKRSKRAHDQIIKDIELNIIQKILSSEIQQNLFRTLIVSEQRKLINRKRVKRV